MQEKDRLSFRIPRELIIDFMDFRDLEIVRLERFDLWPESHPLCGIFNALANK